MGNDDYADHRLRFAFLSRAASKRSTGTTRPSTGRPTLFTLHNVAYQGNFGAGSAALLGLPDHMSSGAIEECLLGTRVDDPQQLLDPLRP